MGYMSMLHLVRGSLDDSESDEAAIKSSLGNQGLSDLSWSSSTEFIGGNFIRASSVGDLTNWELSSAPGDTSSWSKLSELSRTINGAGFETVLDRTISLIFSLYRTDFLRSVEALTGGVGRAKSESPEPTAVWVVRAFLGSATFVVDPAPALPEIDTSGFPESCRWILLSELSESSAMDGRSKLALFSVTDEVEAFRALVYFSWVMVVKEFPLDTDGLSGVSPRFNLSSICLWLISLCRLVSGRLLVVLPLRLRMDDLDIPDMTFALGGGRSIQWLSPTFGDRALTTGGW